MILQYITRCIFACSLICYIFFNILKYIRCVSFFQVYFSSFTFCFSWKTFISVFCREFGVGRCKKKGPVANREIHSYVWIFFCHTVLVKLISQGFELNSNLRSVKTQWYSRYLCGSFFWEFYWNGISGVCKKMHIAIDCWSWAAGLGGEGKHTHVPQSSAPVLPGWWNFDTKMPQVTAGVIPIPHTTSHRLPYQLPADKFTLT